MMPPPVALAVLVSWLLLATEVVIARWCGGVFGFGELVSAARERPTR